MSIPVPRRLTTADLAILTGGASLAFGLIRSSTKALVLFHKSPTYSLEANYRAALLVGPVLLGLASALLAARFIPPRPRWRLVFRQPGTLASVAVLAQMACVVTFLTLHHSSQAFRVSSALRLDINTYLYSSRECGLLVAMGWGTLALTRTWRPEPSWVDRAGRLLGTFAILYWIYSALIW